MSYKRALRNTYFVFFSLFAVGAFFLAKVPFLKGIESLVFVSYADADVPSTSSGEGIFDGGCCNCGVGGGSGDGDY